MNTTAIEVTIKKYFLHYLKLGVALCSVIRDDSVRSLANIPSPKDTRHAIRRSLIVVNKYPHASQIYYHTLQWRHNNSDVVLNHQPHDCLLNLLSRGRSTKTSKLRVTGLCEGNSPLIGEFPAKRFSNAEKVSIWWRHHAVYGSWSGSTCMYTRTPKLLLDEKTAEAENM